MEIREVTPTEPDLFAAWADTMRTAYTHERQGVWWSSIEALTTSFANPSEFYRRIAAVALAGDLVVGGVELGIPLQDNTDSLSVELGVLPSERHRGHGAALADWVRERARQHNRTLIEAEVNVPAGQSFEESAGGRFASAHGMVTANVEDRFLLALPYDEGALQLHEAALPLTSDEVVSWAGLTPEEFLEPLARLKTQMNQDVPTGQLSRAAVAVDVDRLLNNQERMHDQGWVSVMSLALADGEPVGYTEVVVSRGEPEFVLQEDTLVLPEHRGRRLGMRLKCANLRHLMALPHELVGRRQWLQTYTAQSNTPMQRTNEEFGFVKADEMHECEGSITHEA
ncbi:GNAT family N-acetyltransferase [Yimella sp. cx-573]|nr:GNAT family N-acetyltransferase [Yimella sp. cx-573]